MMPFIAEKREVIMRKVCAAILSAAICLAVSGAPAWASEHPVHAERRGIFMPRRTFPAAMI